MCVCDISVLFLVWIVVSLPCFNEEHGVSSCKLQSIRS